MAETIQPNPEYYQNVTDVDRFRRAVNRFDSANAADPNRETKDGREYPRELLYAERLTEWVCRLAPTASEALRLAARCQHLCRWMIPRNSYPMNKPGYLRWRNDLKKFHAQKAGEILADCGYSEEVIQRIQELNRKEKYPDDPEARVLEDALCLVFLQHQFAELAAKTEESKVVNALQKSWNKMTDRARKLAMELPYTPREQDLLAKALSTPP